MEEKLQKKSTNLFQERSRKENFNKGYTNKIAIMYEKLRNNANKIAKTLVERGYKAYFVGGCVRDMVMGIEPKDFDITTDAVPDEIEKIFKKTISVGVKFGVIIVIMDEINYEVATFRSDFEYTDGRHPDTVIFTDEKEDVKRRDFTINGLLFDPIKNELIDYVGGKDDIINKTIKTIGDPFKRFSEDKLRMMRAVRFAARFGYNIDNKTFNAIKNKAFEISEISKERVRDELIKILTGGSAAEGIRLLDKSGLLKEILPEVSNMKGVKQPKKFHPEGSVYTHTLKMLEIMENPSVELAMGVLLHDVGKPSTFEVKERIRFNNHAEIGAEIANNICRRLRFNNKETELIISLVKNHQKFKDIMNMKESTLKKFLSIDNFYEHLELHRLDCLSSHKKLKSWEYCKKKLEEIPDFDKQPKKLIDGNDLIKAGFKPGPDFKKILCYIEDEQLEGRIKSKKEAIKLVIEKFNN